MLIAIFTVGFLTNEVVQVHEYSLLKWVALLICGLGFYLSGLINKKTPLKFVPFLYLALLIFIPLRYFYFPLFFYLFLFATLSLLITRKEFNKKLKISSMIIMASTFIYFLFSQPLIIREGNVVEEDIYGDIQNGTTIWDFTEEKIKTLPNEIFRNINNEAVNLESYKNKIIYISFWATWCKPCLEEKPSLEKLKKELNENSELVFIDISLDTDAERWKSYINKNDPSGIQLISHDEAKIRSLFEISGIPDQLVVNSIGEYRKLISFKLAKVILQNTTNVDEYINKKFVFEEKKWK